MLHLKLFDWKIYYPIQTIKRFHKRTFRFVCYCWLILYWGLPVHAQPMPASPKNFIMAHVGDAYSWHFATIDEKHIELALPIILYSTDRGIECFSSAHFYDPQHRLTTFRGYALDGESISCLEPGRSIINFSITKNIAAMFFSAILLISGLVLVAKKHQQPNLAAPTGYFAFIELLISFIKNEIAIPNIGQNHYKKFLPYLLTIFCFIGLNNLLGLLPGGANVTGNISVTIVLAAFTTLITIFNGNKQYWSHIFRPKGVPIWLLPIMVPIEILGIFTKFFSLMVRLFANITAGHIILLSIIGIIFNLQSIYVGLTVSLPFGTFMLLLKLLVGVLQAYVFTLLSAIYFGQAVDDNDH